ncbi:unnamed protein product [Urochloa humidicola]
MHLRSGRLLGSDEKRRRALASAIPDDLLIYEVLVHLPAKSLARCRCVRRSWRAAIAGAAFVRRHRELSRARRPSTVLAIPREVDVRRDQLPPPPPVTTTSGTAACSSWHPRRRRRAHLRAGLAGGHHAPHHTYQPTATAWSPSPRPRTRCSSPTPATREFVALPLGSHNAELEHVPRQVSEPAGGSRLRPVAQPLRHQQVLLQGVW